MALNIFTDASITKTIYGETIGCSGAVCMENKNNIKLLITRDSTNNIAEITAVKLGILLAIEEGLDEVNIWSDSQWSIFGLTKWMESWMDNSINNILMNSSKVPVKNQQIFLSIIRLIVDNNIRVKFYHIKGHVDVNKIGSIDHAVNVFRKSNGVGISREQMYHAANMNNYIDNATRAVLKSWNTNEPVQFIREVVNPIITKEDLNIYYKLVQLGGTIQ